MGYTHGNKWTKVKIIYLRKLANEYTVPDIVKLMNSKFGTSFTKRSVQHGIKHYGIKRDEKIKRKLMGKNSGYKHGHRWTKEDLEYIKDNKGYLTYKEMAEKLNEIHNEKISSRQIERYISKFRWYKTKEEISKIKSRIHKASPKIQNHIKNLGKLMTSNPEMNKKRAEGMRNSKKYVESKRKLAIEFLANHPNKLKAVSESEKLKSSARINIRKTFAPKIREKAQKKMKETWQKEETKEKYSYLNANPNWIDGRSFEPYSPEFNERTKKIIYEIYGRQCHFPRCKKIEKLSIHHIDYDKKNSSFNNLIPLCISHNSKVNFKRDYWEKYFKKKVEFLFLLPKESSLCL